MATQKLEIELGAHLKTSDVVAMNKELARLGGEKGVQLNINVSKLKAKLKQASDELSNYKKIAMAGGITKLDADIIGLKKKISVATDKVRIRKESVDVKGKAKLDVDIATLKKKISVAQKEVRKRKVGTDKLGKTKLDANIVLFKKKLKEANAKLLNFRNNTDKLGKAKLDADTVLFKKKIESAKRKIAEFKATAKKGGTIKLTADVSNLKKQVSIANRALNNFVATGNTTKSRMGGIMKSLKTGFLSTFGVFSIAGALATSIRGFFRFLGDATNIAISFESAFTGVKKTVNGTDKELKLLSNTLRKLSTEIPVTFEELSKIAEIGGQLGIGIKDIDEFTESVSMIAASTNLTAKQAATSFARIANVTGTPISEIQKMADAVIHLGNNAATTESEILTMSQRIAQAGSTVGLTNDGIFALATTLGAAGIQAEIGGSAVQKTLIQLQKAVIAGGSKLNEFAKTSGLSAEEFKKSWGEDATGTLVKFIEGLRKYGPEGILRIEELLGSEIRLTRVMLALKEANFSYTDAIKLTAQAEGALRTEAEKRFGTSESELIILNNKITLQKELIGKGLIPIKKAWLGVVLSLTTALSKFTNFMGGAGSAIKNLGIFVAILIPLLISAAMAMGLLTTAMLLNPIFLVSTAVVALSVALTGAVRAFQDVRTERRLYKDGIKDVNGNLTELGKKIEEQKKGLIKYKAAQESANKALDTFNKIKVSTVRTRKEFDLLKQEAIVAAKAALDLAKATLLAKQVLQNTRNITGGTSFGLKTGISKSLDDGVILSTDRVSFLQDAIASAYAEIYTAPKSTTTPFNKTQTEAEAAEKALKDLEREMKAYAKETARLRKEKEKLSQTTVKSFFDRISDAIKNANGNMEDFKKEIQGITDEIKALNKEIKELESGTQTDIANRYVEAGNELDELNKKLLEQQQSLSDSEAAVIALGEEMQDVSDGIDTTPFRIILDEQATKSNKSTQNKIDKELENQAKAQQRINDLLAEKLKLEAEIALASEETNQAEKDRAELIAGESIVERLLRERDEKIALIELEKDKLNIQKTALDEALTKEQKYLDILTKKKNILIDTFSYLETAQDKYNQSLDQTIAKRREIGDISNGYVIPSSAINNVSGGGTSNSNTTDNSSVNLSLHLQDVLSNNPQSLQDLQDKFGRAWVEELALKLAKRIALAKKNGG